MSEERFTLEETHRKHAAACFNRTWDYLDMPERSEEDITNMIHCAHASRFHWGQCGTGKNWARGDWQLSRVYAICRQGDTALSYALSCLKLSEEHELSPFDMAFAHEACARSYLVLHKLPEMRQHLELGRKAAVGVITDEDKNYVLGQLSEIETLAAK